MALLIIRKASVADYFYHGLSHTLGGLKPTHPDDPRERNVLTQMPKCAAAKGVPTETRFTGLPYQPPNGAPRPFLRLPLMVLAYTPLQDPLDNLADRSSTRDSQSIHRLVIFHANRAI
jgi:hypothetical protein